MAFLLDDSLDATLSDERRSSIPFSAKRSSILNAQMSLLALHVCAVKVTGKRMGICFDLLSKWLDGKMDGDEADLR